jgi:hypothetical protein
VPTDLNHAHHSFPTTNVQTGIVLNARKSATWLMTVATILMSVDVTWKENVRTIIPMVTEAGANIVATICLMVDTSACAIVAML